MERREVSGADFLASDDDEEDEIRDNPVWSCNWLSFRVFERCKLDLVGGLAPTYNGIGSVEIQSACDMLGVKQRRRIGVLEDVEYMGRVVSDALNKKLAERKSRR